MTSINERDSSRYHSAMHQTWNRKISVSMVTMYQYCPVAAYLRYVEQYIPQSTFKAILGRIVHAAATAFYAAEKQLIRSVDEHSTKDAIAQRGYDIISKAAIRATNTQMFAGPNYTNGTSPSESYKVEPDLDAIAKQGITSLQYFIHQWAERVKRFSTLLGLTGVSLADYLVPCQRRTEVFLEIQL